MNEALQGWLGEQIHNLKDQHLYKVPKILETPAGGRVTVVPPSTALKVTL